MEEFGIVYKVKFFSCDTENTNSGKENGICRKLEDKINQKYNLDRKFIILYCRHHIYEIYLSKAFRSLVGTTVGDKEQIFVNFQNEFDNLDKNLIEPISTKLIAKELRSELTI